MKHYFVDREQERAAFKEALNPDYVYAYNGWGNRLADLGRHQEAIEKFEQALKLDPDNVFAKEQLERKQEKRSQ